MTKNKLCINTYNKGAFGITAVPGSKSMTNRALLLAALAEGETLLHDCLTSEDSELMQQALEELGVTITKNTSEWRINGLGGNFTPGDKNLYLGNAGTAMRFLTSAAALIEGNVRLSGKSRMHERPIGDLIESLQQIGADISSENRNGCPPVIIAGKGSLLGGECRISGQTSSQFLSSLLQIAPLTERGLHLYITPPLVSRPYLEMTLAMLEAFRIKIERVSDLEYIIEPQRLEATEMRIEGDASSAAHVFSLAVAAGGQVTISNFPRNSIQGDAKFVEILKKFGATTSFDQTGMTLRMEGNIQPLGEADFEDMPDVSLAAATIAALARGKSKLTGLSTLRKKECDRIDALRLNLEKMGATVETGNDWLSVEGDPENLHGAEIETFDDHRIAMSFAALGTRIAGVEILDPECTAKTFPNFWEVYETLRNR